MLGIALFGCKSQDQSQFNKDTNQHITFQGISFQVPKEWVKPADKFNQASSVAFAEWRNYDSLEKYLAVSFFEGENLSQHIKFLKDAEHIETSKESNTSIANMSAIELEIIKETKRGRYKFQTVILLTENGIIEIAFYSTKEAGYSDFNKVIDSITISFL